jgi:protein gp37
MTDLFGDFVADEQIDRMFAVMALTPQHTYQVLTKRAARMREWVQDRMAVGMCGAVEHRAKQIYRARRGRDMPVGKTLAGTWPWPHVWLGVSVEDQARWDERKEDLRNTAAAVPFASFEPLLGPIVEPRLADYIQWAITGGKTGPRDRITNHDWTRGIRDQCGAASVAYFHKQNGEWGPADDLPSESQEDLELRGRASGGYFRVGKRVAGRRLDGVEHDGMPADFVNAGA